MEKDALDYLKVEIGYFQKATELQFTHFMQVFYFWTAIVTLPITAGLLFSQTEITSSPVFPVFLVLIALLGWFLSAKMYDIRCSQLKYLTIINYIRGALFNGVKGHLPKNYSLPYPPGTDLRNEAFKDFGPLMAFAMSAIDAVYLGFGIALLNRQSAFNWCASILYFMIGFGTYYALMMWRGPKPQREDEKT
jgi:hypothetical protein